MVSSKVTLALALAFVAVAQAAPGAPGIYGADYHAYPKYSYSYGVADKLTGDQKSAHETRDGDVVKGSYSVVQPDGVLRTVNYVAGPLTGFQAEVVNSGPAVHAVKKVAPVAAVAPIAGYGHGIAAGYGHGIAPVAKAIAPVAAYGGQYGGHLGYAGAGLGYAGAGLGYAGHGALGYAGHGGLGYNGYAPIAAVAKPAAVSYSHGVGPVVGHGVPVGAYGGYYGGAGYGGAGYGHHAY